MSDTRTYPSIQIAAGASMTIPAGDTVIILAYTAGDFGAGCAIRSDTAGVPAYLQMPAAGITETNAVTFKDIDASGGGDIDVIAAGVDEGGNSDNILFPSIIPSGLTAGQAGGSHVAISLGISMC